MYNPRSLPPPLFESSTMAPGALFFPVAASQVTGERNEIDLETLPENTPDEVSSNDQNDIENVGEASSDDVEYVGEDATEDSPDPDNPPRRRRYSSATAFSTFSKSFTLVEQPTWFQGVKYFVFPPKNDVESFLPHYRYTPVISGFLVPFSILLQIPGLTEHWYIRTENHHVAQYRSNPLLLDVGLGISLACAVIANLCLITRFLEVRVKTMTIFCAAFLTIHGKRNPIGITGVIG
jgi:potassium channel subfamily K, other eukaryote